MEGFYSFLPFVRQGLNTFLENNDIITGTSPQRPLLNLKIKLQATAIGGAVSNTDTVKQFALKGPADVTGINSNAIVKVSPANWVTNFEPNYLPYIEFYDEDFCWRYTPAKAIKEGTSIQHIYRLRPWLALVVLKDDEFELFTAPNGKPAIKVKKKPQVIFPAQADLWATAHVHVNDNVGDSDAKIGTSVAAINNAILKFKNEILAKNPDKAVSRLISTRRLQPNTAYTAFLIPVFEMGRRSGLGEPPYGVTGVGMLTQAWNNDTPVDTNYPVYHNWYFKTGGAGDFESLVRLMQPRVLGASVGKSAVDLQKSNHPQLQLITPPSRTIGIQGIVKPAGAAADPWTLTEANAYTKKIREIINKPTTILDTVTVGDPIIAPPIYGRWHAALKEVPAVTGTANWLQEANLDPRLRIYAGAGVETVRRNQEKYMDIAWSQIGEVMEANRKLRQLQLSRQANRALYNKHLYPLNNELVINISGPIHERIRNSAKTATVYKNIDLSRLPVTMFTGAFRRLTRPGGPLVDGIALGSSAVTTTELIAGINAGTITPATAYLAPSGMLPYTIWSAAELTPAFTASLVPNAGFVFSHPGVITGTPAPGTISPPVATMVSSISALHGLITSVPAYSFPTYPALGLLAERNIILTRLEPYNNAKRLAVSTIKKTSVIGSAVATVDTNLILAAPKIKIPMYQELAKLSPDWLMPGLNDVAMNSINILEVNRKYLEAYMLGLNYEMGRELLWRGYPTDQRGTCFSFFWGFNNSLNSMSAVSTAGNRVYNLSNFRDIKDIHQWRVTPTNPTSALTALGVNDGRTAGPSMMIITVRGELLRKYPGTIIYLQKAKWVTPDEARIIDPAAPKLFPVFTAKVEPDIYMLGFNIATATVKGGGKENMSLPGYFVIFQERAGEVRFGADETSNPVPNNTVIPNWDSVTWAQLKASPATDGFIETARIIPVTDNTDSLIWNWNGATVAYALLQTPVTINVHAQSMIP